MPASATSLITRAISAGAPAAAQASAMAARFDPLPDPSTPNRYLRSLLTRLIYRSARCPASLACVCPVAFDILAGRDYHRPMESLCAPWRIQYILAPKPPPSDTSIFARIAQDNDDEANLVVARDRTCFALLNRYPYTGGHLMVVPYKQTPDLHGLTDEELCDVMKLVRRCQDALTQVMKPNGFNIGINLGQAAGAGIEPHLHVHIVPRWVGDTNFMPVLAATVVIPEALTELAAKLRAALAR
jgi:ATP adenylyltransferase